MLCENVSLGRSNVNSSEYSSDAEEFRRGGTVLCEILKVVRWCTDASERVQCEEYLNGLFFLVSIVKGTSVCFFYDELSRVWEKVDRFGETKSLKVV